MELGTKIHSTWDLVESKQEDFTVHDCLGTCLEHWQKVRQNLLTMSGTRERELEPACVDGSEENLPKKKKKEK